MTYVKTSVLKKDSNAGRGGDKKDIISVFDWDDVSAFTFDHDNLKVVALDFSAGKYAVKLYVNPMSLKITPESDGEFDNAAILHNIEAMHPGDAQDIRLFRSNWLNRKIGIQIEKCSTGESKIYGTPCAPLALSFKSADDKDKNENVLTFKSIIKGFDSLDSSSVTLTYDAVKATAAAGATTVDVANGAGEYQLTTGTSSAAAITNLTNAVHGKVYVLLGSGGTYPSTISNSATAFLLKDGTQWTALAGSKITFKCFKDGASSYKFIEVSRS